MYIRRDRSNLHFGRQARRGISRSLLVVWAVTILFVLGVLWKFDSVQSWALAGLGAEPTATMDPVSRAQLGERAYLSGDIEKAIQQYGEALRIAPNNMDIRFEYGRMLIYRSYSGRSYAYRAQEALQVAQEAVEMAPEDPRAQALLCSALVANNRAEEAIQAGLRAVELAPNFSEAHAYLAMAYYWAGRWNSALPAANKAVELNDMSLDAHRALALALAFIGEYDAAIQQFERAIQIHPRFDVLYFEVAQYYIAKNNYDAAILSYDRVLSMEPDNVKAYTRKCELYTRMREDSLAQEACEQAIQLDNSYPEAYRQLGMVKYMRRNYEGAIEDFQRCNAIQNEQNIPLASQEIECYYIQGLAWALLARCDEAWPVLQSALQMNPDEGIKGLINKGLMSCVNAGDRDISEIPTAIPPTPVPPEPIGVF